MLRSRIEHKLVLVGCNSASLQDIAERIHSNVAVQTAAWQQISDHCKYDADAVAYVIDDLNPIHLHNLAILKANLHCTNLFVFIPHLSIPLLCQLLRASVNDVFLSHCPDNDVLRLTQFLQQNTLVQCNQPKPVMHPVHAQTGERSPLANLLEYLEEHFTDKVTLQSVGDQLNLSPSRVSHMFKDVCGIGFNHYLNCRRLEEAEQLLLHHDANITCIAFDLGFANPSHFCRAFKEHLGVTPTAYCSGERSFDISPLYSRYQLLRQQLLPDMGHVAKPKPQIQPESEWLRAVGER